MQAICSPTRGALFTGRYPIHTGMQHYVIKPGEPWGLPLDETTLPQILKQYNYSTHAVGKWHLGFHKWAFTPINRGFDDFFGYYLGAEDYFTHIRDGGLDLRTNTFDKNRKLVDKLRWDLNGQYSPELYSQHTIDLISRHKDQNNPFFIYLAYQSAHSPHQVPQQYIDKYSSHFRDKDQQIFAGMVSAMDEGIGNITRVLRDSGLHENTIVVFSSDNGGDVNCVHNILTSSNYPYRGGKKSLYEGGIRTPTLVWAPTTLLPGKSDAMMHVTDWFPTFVSLASLQGKLQPYNKFKTKPLDGFNQWQVISQNLPSKRNEFVLNIDATPFQCGHQVPQSGVRWKNWKLIVGGGGPPFGWYPAPISLEKGFYCDKNYTDFIELYNVRRDPSETWNVARLYPDIVRFLKNKLKAYSATAVPPLSKPYDPASNPKNFNNTWMPWMEGNEVEQNIKSDKYEDKDFKTMFKSSAHMTGPDDCTGFPLDNVADNIYI